MKKRFVFKLGTLLVVSQGVLFAYPPALIEKMVVTKNRIDIQINTEFKKTYLTDDFFVEYEPDIDLSTMDRSLLIMPFIMNVISAVWISGQEYSVESLDKELAESLVVLKKVFQVMYPKTAWNGNLVPKKLVSNTMRSTKDETHEALLFSGGVDSLSSATAHKTKNLLLVTAWGQWDLPLNDRPLWNSVKKRLVAYAEQNKFKNAFFKSNYAEFLNYEVLDALSKEIPEWRVCTIENLGWAGLTAPLLFVKGYNVLRIASSETWDYPYPLATNPFTDKALKFAGIRLEQDQFDFSRLDKLEFLAEEYKIVERKPQLIVCQNQTGSNCADCSKCLATVMGLIAVGEEPYDWGFKVSKKTAFARTLRFSATNELNCAFIWRMKAIQQKMAQCDALRTIAHYDDFLALNFEKSLTKTAQFINQTELDWKKLEQIVKVETRNSAPSVEKSSSKVCTNYFTDKWQFAQWCDFAYDPENDPLMFALTDKKGGVTFNPSDVRAGNTIFLRARFTDEFFKKIVPHIIHPFIVVAHGEYKDGFRDEYYRYLEHPNLIAWFGTHPCEKRHTKFHALPLGIWANHREAGSYEALSDLFNKLSQKKKKKLVYGNFSLWTHPEREELASIISNNKICKLKEPHLPFINYLKEMADYKFAFSPRGLGIDCYRTWEALLVGTIPIVKHSQLDQLYEGLPIVIVDDWRIITRDFLEEQYAKIKAQQYDMSALYHSYWCNKINDVRNSYFATVPTAVTAQRAQVEPEMQSELSSLQRLKQSILNYFLSASSLKLW